MSIEMGCTGCGQTLRVADEHAGKKARCPACGTIVQVPASGEPAPPEPAAGSPFSGPPQSASVANPFADRPEQEFNPYAAPGAPVVRTPTFARPHRGGLILTFAILGILCCMPFCIAAWVMGAADMKEMRAGRIDRSGQSMTQAGMVIGIVGTVLGALGIIIQVIIFATAGMQ